MLSVALCRVPRQDHPHRGAAVRPRTRGHVALQRPRPFLDRLEAAPPALTGAVVGDLRRDLPIELLDADRDPRRRPTTDRLADRLPDDLVEPDLRLFGEVARRVEIEIDLDLVREPDLLGEGIHRRSEAPVAQDYGLDVEGEVAQR